MSKTIADNNIITHLAHIEDILVSDTHLSNNIKEFITTCKSIINKPDELRISVKIDGAPALYFGIDSTDKKPFVATKTIASLGSPVVKSEEDLVSGSYKDKPDGLKTKLRVALKYLSELCNKIDLTGKIIQGDCIFSSEDKILADDNGTPVIEFTPNTIKYSVDKNSDIGKRVDASEFGIVIHTVYECSFTRDESDRLEMNQMPDPDLLQKIVDASMSINGLFVESAFSSSEAIKQLKFSTDEITKLLKMINPSDLALAEKALTTINKFDSDFLLLLQISINAHLNAAREGGLFKLVAEANIDNAGELLHKFLIEDINTRFGKAIADADKLKTETARVAKQANLKSKQAGLISIIEKEKAGLMAFGKIYAIAVSIKNKLIVDIAAMKSKLGKQFIAKLDEGKLQYIPSKDEGYVVMLLGKGAYKLVDKLDFTIANRNNPKFGKVKTTEVK